MTDASSWAGMITLARGIVDEPVGRLADVAGAPLDLDAGPGCSRGGLTMRRGQAKRLGRRGHDDRRMRATRAARSSRRPERAKCRAATAVRKARVAARPWWRS